MKAIICKKQSDAEQVASETDTKLGMPWPPTAFIGQGPHVLQSTEHLDSIRKHPTKDEYAYASAGLEDLSEGNPKKLKLPKDAKSEELTSDWYPTGPLPARSEAGRTPARA